MRLKKTREPAEPDPTSLGLERAGTAGYLEGEFLPNIVKASV